MDRFRLIGTIESALLNELKQGMSRPGQMVNVSFKPSIDLQMMEHTWHRAKHSIRHMLQPWKYCNAKVIDNDVDLNEIKEIIHLDFRIKILSLFDDILLNDSHYIPFNKTMHP